jgi:hypothetical protein
LNGDGAVKRYQTIKVHFCTEDTLPDFKDRDVMLSIDGDYLSNSGDDTYGNQANNRDTQSIREAGSALLQTLNDKNIRPAITDLTMSIGYTPIEDVLEIERFFDFIVEKSPQGKDEKDIYRRDYNSSITSSKPNRKGI